MSFTEKMMALVHDDQVIEGSTTFLLDVTEALMGNPFAAARVFLSICKMPSLFNEQRFWSKMEEFLNGVFLYEEDRAKFTAKLTENGENYDNPYRLAECINRAETKRKIRYIINATRCLLSDFIETSEYFRICQIIAQTIDEDLIFLRDHIGEHELPYSFPVQGLLNVGIMYQNVYDANGDQYYSFTPLAELVDKFAVSYDDVSRYPNPLVGTIDLDVPRVQLNPMTATEEDIDNLF